MCIGICMYVKVTAETKGLRPHGAGDIGGCGQPDLVGARRYSSSKAVYALRH